MLEQIGDEITAILIQKTVNALPSGAVRFDKTYTMVNLSGTAFTGSLSTLDFTDAQKGAVFTVDKHNAGTNPLATIPAINVFAQLGTYQLNQDNYIQFVYLGLDGANHKVLIVVSANIDYNALINQKENIVGYNDILKGFVSTQSYNLLCAQGFARSTAVGTQNGAVRAFPFILNQDITIDQIQVEVTTPQAGGLVRFCFYLPNTSNYPTTIVANSEFEIATDTIGIKTYTPSSPIVLPRGLYFQAHNANNTTPLLRSAPNSAIMRTLGSGPNAGATQLINYTNYSLSLAYGAMPATYTAGATITNEQGAPILTCRMA
jgi:hypothetical protein